MQGAAGAPLLGAAGSRVGTVPALVRRRYRTEIIKDRSKRRRRPYVLQLALVAAELHGGLSLL